MVYLTACIGRPGSHVGCVCVRSRSCRGMPSGSGSNQGHPIDGASGPLGAASKAVEENRPYLPDLASLPASPAQAGSGAAGPSGVGQVRWPFSAPREVAARPNRPYSTDREKVR